MSQRRTWMLWIGRLMDGQLRMVRRTMPKPKSGEPVRVLFLGSKAFGLRVLQALKVATPSAITRALTIDDSSDGRSVLPRLVAFAKEAGIELTVCESRVDAKRAILDYAPDMCFVCGWYWLFDKETIDSVPDGMIGIHNSLLPKYRGGAPLVWALINGETTVGSSVFEIGYGMDDGRIIWQVEVPVGENDAIADVQKRLEDAMISRITGGLWRDFLEGRIVPILQNHDLASFSGQRLPEDGLIDWTMDAAAVHNFIRAQSPPYPGAFTLYEGHRITIVRSRRVPSTYYGRPGQILERRTGCVTIACGNHTAIYILDALKDGAPLDVGAIFRSTAVRLR